MSSISFNNLLSQINDYLNSSIKLLIKEPCTIIILDDKGDILLNWNSGFEFRNKPENSLPLDLEVDELIVEKLFIQVSIEGAKKNAQTYAGLISFLIKESIQKTNNQKSIEQREFITFAIMNAVHFGIISTNLNGEINYANDHACRLLNIRRRDLLQIPVKKLIPNWQGISKIVSSGNEIQNEDTVIKSNADEVNFNLNVSSIVDSKQNKIGFVITFRSIEKVYQLVNKYTGMNAKYSFKDIIGKSKIMRQTVEYAKTVANSPSTILIEGESGTGKEVFAQSIHNASNRKNNSFVAINCAAISENLIESELFGYDDGAFTGAKKGGHPGKFELANNGTLFLDEIGDMKPDMQVKLLRAIQESSITRVGGDKVIPIDVRIIAATNKNLQQEVEKGKFRLDLYYRISVIPMHIPSLKDRKGDIPSLIRFFLNQKSLKLQKDIPHMSYSELQQLLDYEWPGNVRELENYIEQLVNFNGKISLDSFKLLKHEEFKDKVTINKTIENSPETFTELSLEEIEKRHIAQTLSKYFGNITQTAKSLGIGRNTLYQKINKHNINFDRPLN